MPLKLIRHCLLVSRLDQYRIERQLSLGLLHCLEPSPTTPRNTCGDQRYLPNSLALRGEGEVEPVISAENEPAFRWRHEVLLKKGVTGKLMHPNVVRVLNFFAPTTRCMVMQFERGRTLHEYVNKHRDVLRERFCAACSPACSTVCASARPQAAAPGHQTVQHLSAPGRHAGAARFWRGTPDPDDRPADAQADVHPGFASPEQFAGREHLGPWSDIYSVGASMYACLAGSAPRSDERTKDTYMPAAKAFAGRHTEQLLDTIDWCLHLDPLARPKASLYRRHWSARTRRGHAGLVVLRRQEPAQNLHWSLAKFTIYRKKARIGKRASTRTASPIATHVTPC